MEVVLVGASDTNNFSVVAFKLLVANWTDVLLSKVALTIHTPGHLSHKRRVLLEFFSMIVFCNFLLISLHQSCGDVAAEIQGEKHSPNQTEWVVSERPAAEEAAE